MEASWLPQSSSLDGFVPPPPPPPLSSYPSTSHSTISSASPLLPPSSSLSQPYGLPQSSHSGSSTPTSASSPSVSQLTAIDKDRQQTLASTADPSNQASAASQQQQTHPTVPTSAEEDSLHISHILHDPHQTEVVDGSGEVEGTVPLEQRRQYGIPEDSDEYSDTVV